MKFNVKHLMAVSTVILAMIGAGGAINANNVHAHADMTASQLLNDPEVNKDAKEDEKASNNSEHEEHKEAEPQRKQQAKTEMQSGFLDRDFYKDPAVHHYLRKLGYSNHQMKKGIAVEDNDNNNNDVHYGSKAENRLARKAERHTNRHYRKHSKKSARKHNRHYKKTIKRNRKIRKRVNKRSPKRLSYYAQGKKLGKYIHHNKDDNYGGVQYLLSNKKVFNKQFDNGYFKGYTTADPGDDENPAPRARVAFKVAKTYQSSHSKTFKQGVRDSFKNYFYGRFNKHYSHNKSYKYGYHYFRSLSAKSNQNW